MPLATIEIAKRGLTDCGYSGDLLQPSYMVGMPTGRLTVPLAGFAHRPFDSRSACVAVLDSAAEPNRAFVSKYRPLGAPVVLVCHDERLQWWRQNGTRPELLDQVERSQIRNFFSDHRDQLGPREIYRAKTLGSVCSSQQLRFVDAGLMPLVEHEAGEHLSGLVTETLKFMSDMLGGKDLNARTERNMFRSVFWLITAKILRDKDVPAFQGISLSAVDEVFDRVARHYGVPQATPPRTGRWRAPLRDAAGTVEAFTHLGNISTEALGYIYENALITPDLRKQLGTHSTPPYLVDYIVWQLAPWIEEIPREHLRVFEPSCGHAAFLVSTVRLIKERLRNEPEARLSRFLRKRIQGIDIDSFALEIARLSLTLADIPNPNGWQLEHRDMFLGDTLAEDAAKCTVLLMNPPYSRFSLEEKNTIGKEGGAAKYNEKALEVLSRTIPALPSGAVFGAVLPQGFLKSTTATVLRKLLVEQFELSEVCLFPDKVFRFSDIETTVVVGRKLTSSAKGSSCVRYRRVREHDVERFRDGCHVTSERLIPQSRFGEDAHYLMNLPELEEVWRACKSCVALSTIADIGKGFDFIGEKNREKDLVNVANEPFDDALPGFLRFERGLMIHEIPEQRYLNVSRRAVQTPRIGTTTRIPQVLLNYSPVSRGPWRLKALLDHEGHAVTSAFLAVRPLCLDVSLEYLWALCNSPFANAYMFTHCGKRHNLAGVLAAMPVPHPERGQAALKDSVRAYFEQTSRSDLDKGHCRMLLERIDAAILRLYDLPPRLERQLLDLFDDYPRVGVPFEFDRYYPQDFRPAVPLHVYISEAYSHSTAGELRERWRPVKSEALLASLTAATEAFGGD